MPRPPQVEAPVHPLLALLFPRRLHRARLVPELAASVAGLLWQIAYDVPFSWFCLLDTLACLVDGAAAEAVESAGRTARWAGDLLMRGDAYLLLAIARHMFGDRRAAGAALRRGRRLAPHSPLLGIAERQLAAPDTTIAVTEA